jgi:hypothetical protein
LGNILWRREGPGDQVNASNKLLSCLHRKIATALCFDGAAFYGSDTMILEYRVETKFAFRVLYLLLLTFVAALASFMISFFDLFSGEAYKLFASIIGGDMTRLGDFLGYLALLIVIVGCSGGLMFGLVHEAVFKTNHVAEIDTQSHTVIVRYFSPWPWSKKRSATYRFDELAGLKLRYDSEESEVLLYLPDRRRPLTLVAERDRHVAQQKFKRLRGIGLPSY